MGNDVLIVTKKHLLLYEREREMPMEALMFSRYNMELWGKKKRTQIKLYVLYLWSCTLIISQVEV